ncbi:porin [Limnohabitans sp.]|uniref:porin n=1 Tax=Limnohabitans sp. TaxID=1907725 RepID=UPI0039BCBA56
MATLAVAGTSFAQSSVTIGGIVEIAPFHTGTVTTRDAGAENPEVQRKSTRTAGPNTWATSVLNISGTEDLGGGLSASFFLMTGLGTLPNTNTNAADGGIGNRERSLSVTSKDLGTLRFGRFVAAPGTGFHAFSGAGSATMPGSSYGFSQGHSATAAGDFGHNNFHANANPNANYERQNNLLQFTSNAMNGFTVTVAHGRDSLDRTDVTRPGETKNEYTGVQLGYVAGPLSLAVGINERKGETEAAAAVPFSLGPPTILPVDAVTNSTNKGSLNWVGASYNFGPFALFGHHATREEETTSAGVTTTANDMKITGLGISAPIGAWTLRASANSGKDSRGVGNADNMKLAGHQVSAVYALSKRTSLIAAAGKNEYKRDGAESTAATRKYESKTLTVMHTF